MNESDILRNGIIFDEETWEIQARQTDMLISTLEDILIAAKGK